MSRRTATYVLPLRWERDRGLEELASYLEWLVRQVGQVIVVDGSPDAAFRRHASRFPESAIHVRPARDLDFAMGKVNGVLSGLRLARNESVVIADDDVRWDAPALDAALALLAGSDVVRPQNYFDPLPWHARLDSARSLLNRGFSGDLELGAADFPGTLLVRRSALERTGGYDGDALFENLELMRTVAASGGRVASPLGLYVRRLPPDTSHFVSQRVRQAYDDFALPIRMGFWLSVVPTLALGRHKALTALVLGSVALAETGRRRRGGTRVFPASIPFLAPVWVLERSVSAWLALWQRIRHGGVRYAGRRVRLSSTSTRRLRRRYEERTAGSGRSASPSAAPSA